MTARYTSIVFEARDGVGHIFLNRPDAANSLNATLSSELMDAVVRCEVDPDIRALIAGAIGRRFFCAGADLKGFYAEGSELKSRVSLFHAVLTRRPKPNQLLWPELDSLASPVTPATRCSTRSWPRRVVSSSRSIPGRSASSGCARRTTRCS